VQEKKKLAYLLTLTASQVVELSPLEELRISLGLLVQKLLMMYGILLLWMMWQC